MKKILGILFIAAFWSCSSSTSPGSDSAPLSLTLNPAQDDGRVYGVGRVQMRAFDENLTLLAFEIIPVERDVSQFEVDFNVPAGPGRILVVEPLGSAVLPAGGKTESGVALQAVSEPVDVAAGEILELEVDLTPFIPNNVRFAFSNQQDVLLNWDAMPKTESHEIRVFELDSTTEAERERVVAVGATPSVRVLDLFEEGFSPRAFQVRSVNRFSTSAYSDTLFAGRGGKGTAR